MIKSQNALLAGIFCASAFFLAACDSGGDGFNNNLEAGNEQSTPSGVLEDESANVIIPDGTNLRINYADPNYELMASPDYILQQWNDMKSCLQVEAPDPYVLIEREVLPPDNATDVIELPGDQFAASVLDREYDAFIQIRVDDFDPQTESRGFFFRQIIGPYMWRYNGYPDQTYDYYCAAVVVQ